MEDFTKRELTLYIVGCFITGYLVTIVGYFETNIIKGLTCGICGGVLLLLSGLFMGYGLGKHKAEGK